MVDTSYSIENEKESRFFFLDIQIIHEDKTFTISAYRAPTFSEVDTNFNSFLTSTY